MGDPTLSIYQFYSRAVVRTLMRLAFLPLRGEETLDVTTALHPMPSQTYPVSPPITEPGKMMEDSFGNFSLISFPFVKVHTRAPSATGAG